MESDVKGFGDDEDLKLKAVILIGGPAKGTRFRPLSLELPKPLFPLAGYPIIYHHIEACSKVEGMQEIILIGFFQLSEDMHQFIYHTQNEFNIQIRYLQEFTPLGTAGGLYHFRDQILSGSPHHFFCMNADLCCDFPLEELLDCHLQIGPKEHFTIMATEATREQSKDYGSIVLNKDTREVMHYVEKPRTFVSSLINCGVYVFTPGIFKFMRIAFLKHQEENFNFDFKQKCKESIHLEREVFQPLAGCGKLYVYQTYRFWSQIKSPGAAIYANCHYLEMYKQRCPDRLATNGENKPTIIGEVFIHPTANVHPSAKIGPNVSIGRFVTVGYGVRVRESILLQGAAIREHACVLGSVVGAHAIVGKWCRVEGTPADLDPNKAFAKLDTTPVFNEKGQLNPSITVIGSHAEIPPEIVVLNAIVLPHKELSHSYMNQIIL